MAIHTGNLATTSYRLNVVRSLWNLIDDSTSVLPSRLSNCKTILFTPTIADLSIRMFGWWDVLQFSETYYIFKFSHLRYEPPTAFPVVHATWWALLELLSRHPNTLATLMQVTRDPVRWIFLVLRVWRFSKIKMTSPNENIFRTTGPMCGKSIGHRWIPLTKASDAELWCFLWSLPWIKNREADDLRRHRTHYDVIVML